MITGMTVGAGVLGLPFVVAQVGIKIGLVYIFVLGLVMLFLNLMMGEIAVRTKEPLQLPGFAGKYLGKWAKWLLSLTIISSSIGVLLAYIVGEGETLATLFGGDPMYWSIGFWVVGGIFVVRGLSSVKSVEKVLSLLVMTIIAALSFYFLPKMDVANWSLLDFSNIFLPYGVILFAMHATPAVVEAHTLLPGSQVHFRRAVVLGTLIPMVLYMLFAAAVVGVGGRATTPVSTIGLGAFYGGWVMIVGNVFAALAMGTAFMGMGVALKHTFIWDFKMKRWMGSAFTLLIPLALFMFGFKNFVAILDVVGGVFIGIEAIMIVAICSAARHRGDIDGSRFGLKYFWPIAIPVLIVFSLASLISVGKLLY